MGASAAVWIDQKRAVIVTVAGSAIETKEIASDVETQPRRAGDSPLAGTFERMLIPADDSRQRALSGRMDDFYHKVIAAMGDAEAVLLLGPGETKGQLQQHLQKSALRGRPVAVETADKMTARQVAARAKAQFGADPRRRRPETRPPTAPRHSGV